MPVPQVASKDYATVDVIGVPSQSVQNGQIIVGDSYSSSQRSYKPLKVLGDGSFGTVSLCDWRGTLPPNTPLPAMQCSARAKPEWAGAHLVAVKRMKRQWEGGWDECKQLNEIVALRAIPAHPNIIALYDAFLLPASKELYFVFEAMEGNLYHLMRVRKGRAFAGGLVCSIFHQMLAGLHHIHSAGYFHRDIKPENVLVTTTGVFDYTPVMPNVSPGKEKDIVVLIKLADFGLARATVRRPPHTEYVQARWYRAPEVLLLGGDYASPVDMWALGAVMAEVVNLRPLFPGASQVDQIARICEVLGDPGVAGWPGGIVMAAAVGFAFPKVEPISFESLFDRSVPRKLVECIANLVKYDPEVRLTSQQCLEHPYFLETLPMNEVPMPARAPAQTLLPDALRVSAAKGLPPFPPPPSRSCHGAAPELGVRPRSPVPVQTIATSVLVSGEYGTFSSPNEWGIDSKGTAKSQMTTISSRYDVPNHNRTTWSPLALLWCVSALACAAFYVLQYIGVIALPPTVRVFGGALDIGVLLLMMGGFFLVVPVVLVRLLGKR